MLCKNCGLRPATTHIKRVINGRVEEYHLCAECAKKMNVSAFDPFDLSELWGSFFGDRMPDSPSINQKRCKTCGSSFSDIANLGKLGCPDCYSEFYNELLPSLRKIHGKTRHVGKLPNSANENTKAGYMIADLKKKLADAVENEDYEQAATLRDQIKEYEKKMNDDGAKPEDNGKKEGECNE